MTGVENCSETEKRAALERVLQSRTFSRSEQLRSFLQYVCEAHFQGTADSVSEYLIGVKVLHRPPAYSPSEDSSVRTRAYELRQKLEKLYSTELTNEQIQIEIPKGSYMPVFALAHAKENGHAALPITVEAVVPRQPEPKTLKSLSVSFVALALLLVTAMGCGALTMYLLRAQTAVAAPSPPVPDPIVAEAWAPFAKRPSSVLLVAATPLFLVLGPESHGGFKTPTYPAPSEAYPLFREHRPLPAPSKLGMIFTGDAVGVGNMNAVVLASNVLRELGAVPQVLPERTAMMSVIHGRDTVLFGAPVDSQAISDLLEKTPMSVVYDESVKEFVVRDRETGQVFYPEKEANGDFRTVYGLVSVLNTRDSDRGRLGMVIFSGVTSVGVHGAAEYFTSPHLLRQLRNIFAKEGVNEFPAAYQVVVKCKFENMLLVGVEYRAHRILNRD